MRSDCHLGFAITGSFCTFEKIKKQIELLRDEAASITPIFSQHAYELDTRFAEAKSFVKEIETITGRSAIHTIQGAEPVGPKKLFDALVIAPCTGNTAAKLANGITDTPVLMAAKSHLRNGRPVIIAISTNDALGINLQNIGKLMVMKHIYFVPFGHAVICFCRVISAARAAPRSRRARRTPPARCRAADTAGGADARPWSAQKRRLGGENRIWPFGSLC